jgi:PAS domain S-box-containing protein
MNIAIKSDNKEKVQHLLSGLPEYNFDTILFSSEQFDILMQSKQDALIFVLDNDKDKEFLLLFRKSHVYTPIILLGDFDGELYEGLGVLSIFAGFSCEVKVISMMLHNKIEMAIVIRERDMLSYAIDRWNRYCVITDKISGKILYTNTYTINILGYNKEELIGKCADILFPEHFGNGNREIFLKKLVDIGYVSELHNLHLKDGSTRWFFIDSYACNGFILSTGVDYTQIEEKLGILKEKIYNLTKEQ